MAKQTDNEVKEAIGNWIKKATDGLHVCCTGKIEAFDSSSNRASITPCGKFKIEDGRELDFPTIYNVPVYFPCGAGGSAGITFPIRPGDLCIVVFADSQLDDFLGGRDCEDPRKHSMNDAIAIPGLYSNAVPTVSGNPNDLCLVNAGSKVVLNGSKMSINLSDGTDAVFGGGDLVVNGISLTKHVHGGVVSGGSTTSVPQ